jgi:hypothetical protein
MTKHLQPGIIFFLIISCCSCGTGKNKGSNKGMASTIAAAYGVNEFPGSKAIEFTFHVQKDTMHLARHWKWMPKENKVVYYEAGDSVVFQRMDTTTAQLKKLNAQFTNDEYWLLFPLHLQWDDGYTFTDSGLKPGPLSGLSYHQYSVQYNDKDGFTPGDRYVLYVDSQQLVREWAFHKSGAPGPTIVTTWEGYEKFNGLTVAKEHSSGDGKFRVYFTGVTVSK